MSDALFKNISFQISSDILSVNSEIMVIFVSEADFFEQKIVSPRLTELDKKLTGLISLAGKDFGGKWLQSISFLNNNSVFSPRILLIGIGDAKCDLPAKNRQLGIKIAEEVSKLKLTSVALYSVSDQISEKEHYSQIAIGINLGLYKYSLATKTDAEISKENDVSICVISNNSEIKEHLQGIIPLFKSLNNARQLQDSPPNIATPTYIANYMSEKAQSAGLKCEVWGLQKLKEMGFNAMLAVAEGSDQEPKFVIIEYIPQNYSKTVAFVGKGLTIDTGGYSIKGREGQLNMKYDMCGAAITLNSILAIAEMQIPVRVIAIGALCENMISGNAYRVGDILKSYSGKTIEILNTDAEGRIVLCDALAYVSKELKPDFIVEFSTLTGAMVMSLGHLSAGTFTFGNTMFTEILTNSANNTGENIWILPTFEEMGEDLKSPSADLANVGTNGAGSIFAAMFLKEFTGDVPYAHIDIAGVANGCLANGYPKKISSGYGIQLSVEIAKEVSKLS